MYTIAGIHFALAGEERPPFVFLRDWFRDYLEPETVRPTVTIRLEQREVLEQPPSKILVSAFYTWAEERDGGYAIYESEPGESGPTAMVRTDVKWERPAVYVAERRSDEAKDENSFRLHVYYLLGLVFRNAILRYRAFVLHASAIAFDGQGLAFTAPSGTGKSTHTELWKALYGSRVRIVNDDMPAVRILGDKPFLFGTPWSGSAFKNTNVSAPLTGIVVIERAPRNAIARLSNKEALLALLPRVLLPAYSEEAMDAPMQTVQNVMETVPVYRLGCTIDYEAVELVRKCVLPNQ